MKIFAVICIVCGQVLCGCGNASSERQITELQSRFDRMEVRLDKINANNASNFDGIYSINQDMERLIERLNTNQVNLAARVDLLALEGRLQGAIYSNFTERLDALEKAKPTNRMAGPIRSAPVTLKAGIPAGIYDQIHAEAERKWPGDFDMQAYDIEKQVDAYKKLHP
jgi:hypothetical protein